MVEFGRAFTRKRFSRPSSRYVDEMVASLRRQRQPSAGVQVPPPPERKEEEKKKTYYSLHDLPLNLNHPLIRAADFCRHCGYAAGVNQRTSSFAPSQPPVSLPLLTFYHRLVVPAGVYPNHFSFPLLLKLFSRLNLPAEGQTTHAGIAKLGFEADVFVRNSLIHMYASFGDIVAAETMFASCAWAECDTVSYNSMIDGYVKSGMLCAARKMFDQMPVRDLFSWNVLIAGYAGNGDMDAARELFWMMPERDCVSWNTMIDGHARIQQVSIARKLFDDMPVRNLVSWNVMLALYVRVKGYEECLHLFDAMMATTEAKPDRATLVSVLTACTNLGRLERGEFVHSLVREGSFEPDVLLWTALLTMYAKCGAIECAEQVFDQMPERNIVSWNSMIMGYGLHGQTDRALELFLEMEKSDSVPNDATFVCILSACAQSGFVLEGWWCFEHMVRSYKMRPKAEHLGCMINLLGRFGLLKDTAEFVKALTEKPTKALWGTLMSSCWVHSNWGIGKFLGQKLVEIMPDEVEPYILLSNMCAAEGNWEEVRMLRRMVNERGLQKGPGVSLVGLDDSFSEDLRNERSLGGQQSKMSIAYSMLREMGDHFTVSWTKLHENEGIL
ncbi:hypothetical protein HPP92_015380 [Vanilla planifolia]|uniref:Chlororespiratory reduction 4 n=2 Tax=Vanilla planifolia TaxID=51239 RepID=A0A835QTA1_VANPL|nr:hypothetical protein HPP92_015380 [Vanilla planifolia]